MSVCVCACGENKYFSIVIIHYHLPQYASCMKLKYSLTPERTCDNMYSP